MGTHPIFESDFDCLTDGTDLKWQWPALRTLINLPSLSLSLTSSRTLAKSRFPHGLTRSKTATHKELSPYNQDWYYIRCASLARHLYMRGNAGVGAFRKVYGG